MQSRAQQCGPRHTPSTHWASQAVAHQHVCRPYCRAQLLFLIEKQLNLKNGIWLHQIQHVGTGAHLLETSRVVTAESQQSQGWYA